MERLLLHVCCANCGLVPIEILKTKFDLTLFWYNPNIQPPDEHARRLKNFYQLAKVYNLKYLLGPDSTQAWDKMVQKNNLTSEPEGAARCAACFKWRLSVTAQTAQKNNFPYFATTLGISRYKNTELIDRLGREAGQQYQVQYYPLEIDKNAAAQEEIKLSKKYNFYRQKYCGCLYAKIAQADLAKKQK